MKLSCIRLMEKFIPMLKRNVVKIAGALAIIVFMAVLASCSGERDHEYKYFVSKESVSSYSLTYINTLLNGAEGYFPEISVVRPYIEYPVDIFKVVYLSEAGGQEISASGLVCVPRGDGEFPVLSFQNGTNTLNSACPTEFPSSPMYQFVEIIASMGFVVIIPDYPGFGESADIAHPYLIREPTVRSGVDMLYALHEMDERELPDISVSDDVYLAGYSQGGWATLALHEALENDYSGSFNLRGSVCGAGPYDLTVLFSAMSSLSTYPMPVYIAYIINSYSVYRQFTNPVSDLLREPYASRLAGLYNGQKDSGEINASLTTSIPDLFAPGFLEGIWTDQKYSSLRDALASNSIAGWNTKVPLYFLHGGGDTSVDPVTTESIYDAMIEAGTSPLICKKEILPGLDHGDAVVPAMLKGLEFLIGLQ